MATIPIEVIIQDAESPVTPTPVDPADQGENTNITVPDTGVGTVDSNSNNIFTNSSVAISIVSIIIAVLAIGAVIALSIRKYNKRNKTNIEASITRQEKRAMAVTSTIAVLALTVLLGQLVVAGVVSPLATNAATGNETDRIDVANKISIVIERTAEEDESEAIVESTSTITSTADFGYKVLLAMAEGADTANLYLDGDETSEYYIAPVNNEEDEAVETAETNIWGYALEEDGEYSAMPLADDAAVVAKEVATVEDKEIPVYYGVRVSKDLPNGTYTGELAYDLTDYITTMQEMTSDICDAVPTPGNQVTDPVPTATLTDIRDDKTYTIAKLADGKCWMTQNLDLDLDETKTLTPADTNITENWTPMRSTISFTGTSVNGWSNSDTSPCSADPGDIYYYTSGTNDNDIQYNSLTECEAAGHTDCSHYHAGNYYNWTAAVASNDSSAYTEEYSYAETSICPLGWRLPNSVRSREDVVEDVEQIAMISNYEGILGNLTTCGPSCAFYGYLQGGLNAVRVKPLWLVRAGETSISLEGVAEIGYYLSNTKGESGTVFNLNLYPNQIWPVGTISTRAGASVRCVAE